MIPYDVVEIDLTTPQLGLPVAGAASPVTSWTVLELPAGTGATLRMGQSGRPIQLEDGMSWEYDPCMGPVMDGLWFDLAVAAAGRCLIAVFFGSGNVTVGS